MFEKISAIDKRCVEDRIVYHSHSTMGEITGYVNEKLALISHLGFYTSSTVIYLYVLRVIVNMDGFGLTGGEISGADTVNLHISCRACTNRIATQL